MYCISERSKPLGSRQQRTLVLVYAPQSAAELRIELLCNMKAVSSAADGAVYIAAARLYLQRIYYLFEKNGDMIEFHIPSRCTALPYISISKGRHKCFSDLLYTISIIISRKIRGIIANKRKIYDFSAPCADISA